MPTNVKLPDNLSGKVIVIPDHENYSVFAVETNALLQCLYANVRALADSEGHMFSTFAQPDQYIGRSGEYVVSPDNPGPVMIGESEVMWVSA